MTSNSSNMMMNANSGMEKKKASMGMVRDDGNSMMEDEEKSVDESMQAGMKMRKKTMPMQGDGMAMGKKDMPMQGDGMGMGKKDMPMQGDDMGMGKKDMPMKPTGGSG